MRSIKPPERVSREIGRRIDVVGNARRSLTDPACRRRRVIKQNDNLLTD
jgi:hypothetical protein